MVIEIETCLEEQKDKDTEYGQTGYYLFSWIDVGVTVKEEVLNSFR